MMIVVIDGPAGAGKSSTAQAVARRAGLDYIDSGAMYRGFTVLFNELHHDKETFFEAIEQERLYFEFDRDASRVFLDGREVTDQLRDPEVNEQVSVVAAMPQVREQITRELRKAVGDSDCIAEGRDLGTVVFPDAELKFFLTADIQERARRRHLEMAGKDEESDSKEFQGILENLQQRDTIDSSRKEAPLQKAEDAIELDTTSLSFDRQVAKIIEAIERVRAHQSDS